MAGITDCNPLRKLVCKAWCSLGAALAAVVFADLGLPGICAQRGAEDHTAEPKARFPSVPDAALMRRVRSDFAQLRHQGG